MPNSPYDNKRPPFDAALFAAYERANRAAARQYAALPSAARHAQLDHVHGGCIHCGRLTRSSDGQCARCKKAVVGG